jgi:hypothetical protein
MADARRRGMLNVHDRAHDPAPLICPDPTMVTAS